ncbi:MAG TPA: hypothetical protein VF469_18945 [Kofleriaceae bacterium]
MSIRAILTVLPLAFAAACGNSGNSPKDAPVPIDAGPPDAACFTDPKTNDEIINACTTAVKVYKDSHPKLQRANGSLPPLP